MGTSRIFLRMAQVIRVDWNVGEQGEIPTERWMGFTLWRTSDAKFENFVYCIMKQTIIKTQFASHRIQHRFINRQIVLRGQNDITKGVH